VDRHQDAIALWFARSTELGSPLSADEAADNVRELLSSYTDVLVSRARVLHALDEMVAEDPAVFALATPDRVLRACLETLRSKLRGGVGVLALTRSGLDLPLPRRADALVERVDEALPALEQFFEKWPEPQDGPWPNTVLVELAAARKTLGEALSETPQPGLASLAHASALDAFDDALDDAVELVQAMLHLAECTDAANLLEPSWSWPGSFESRGALSEVASTEIAVLLGASPPNPGLML
jgi:hypothetical protein